MNASLPNRTSTKLTERKVDNGMPIAVRDYIESSRRSKEVMIAELRDAGVVTFDRHMCCCPFCNESNPSGSIYDRGGVWKFKCHSGSQCFQGDFLDVRARRMNTTTKELVKAMCEQDKASSGRKEPKRYSYQKMKEIIALNGNITDEYKYDDPATGKAKVIVYKLKGKNGKKTFRQVTPVGSLYEIRGPQGKWPIYNRGMIATCGDEPVVVVEGEKDVESLRKMDIVATTSMAGAGKAHKSDWSPLAGKNVYLWPDNDDAGKSHMEDVANILATLTPKPSVYLINGIDSLPPKSDATDYAKAAWDATDKAQAATERLRAVRGAIEAFMKDGLTSASQTNYDEFLSYLEDVESGKIVDYPMAHPQLCSLTHAYRSGMLTVLFGSPGAAKSWFVWQEVYELSRKGIPNVCLMLEQTRSFFHARTLAYLTGDARLQSLKYVKDNMAMVRGMADAYRDEVNIVNLCVRDDLLNMVESDPQKRSEKEMLLVWIEQQFKAGVKIVFIDPVTKLDSGRRVWEEDHKLVVTAKKLAEDYDGCIVFVTHPSKNSTRGVPSLMNAETMQDMVAGGKAWSNFCQTMIRIEGVEEQDVQIANPSWGGSTTPARINRKVYIAKSNNSTGQNLCLGFMFGEEMRFKEYGIITKKQTSIASVALDDEQEL